MLIEQVADSLYSALSATARVIDFLRAESGSGYVADHNPANAIPAACAMYAACHYPSTDADRNTTLHSAGFITVNPSRSHTITELVTQANLARTQFGTNYTTFNRASGTKNKASGHLAEFLRTSIRPYPLIIKKTHICSRQITRRFILLENVEQLGFYQEPIRRCERVEYKELVKLVDALPQGQREVIAAKLTGIPKENLRFIYDGATSRFRSNVKFNDGSRSNIALSMPLIVLGTPARFTPLENYKQGNAQRRDTGTYTPLIEGLNLYAKL